MNQTASQTQPHASLSQLDDHLHIRVDDKDFPEFWMELLINRENKAVASCNGRHIYPQLFQPNSISIQVTPRTSDLIIRVRDAAHLVFALDLHLSEAGEITLLDLTHPTS